MKRSVWKLLAVLLALSLVAAACGDDDDEEAAPGAVDGEEEPAEDGCEETVPGTQVDYGVFAPTASLDPPHVSGALVGGTELANIYDVLMTFDFETRTYEPRLAESLEPNDDFTEWTLTLRDGITYSDGTPLTAQLVSDNIERFLEPNIRNTSGGFLAPIQEMRVVDERSLVFDLDLSWPEFPFVLADEPGMVVNLNAIGDDRQAFGLTPPDAAGVGPYVVERNVPGEELVMRARDDYWGGPVCIETLRFTFVPGAQASLEAFNADNLDVAFLRDPTVISEAREAAPDEVFFIQQDAGALIILNHADGRVFNDVRLREAAILAMDPETINDRAYQGNLIIGKSLVMEGSRFYSDAIDEFPTDPERASELVDEVSAEGGSVAVNLVCADAPPAPETALAVEGMLEAVGFDVTVTTKPTAEQIGQVIQGDFDGASWGFNAGPATGITTFARNLRSDSPSNRLSYGTPEMDEALDSLFSAQGEEEQQEAMARINSIFLEDWVSLNYGSPEEGIIWDESIRGITPTVATIFLFGDAYIAE